MCRGAGIHANTGTPISSVSGYNNIVYFNQATANPDVHGNINFTYSCVDTFLSGTGNITSNPLFVDALNNDYHLQSGSPCIDSGNPASPQDPDSTIADMGALYFPQLSSLSVSPSSLSFYVIAGTGNPADQTFQISNSGSGTFNYTLSESISWLTVTPTSGGPVPPNATETVSVDIGGLSVGTYQGDIIVTAIGAQGSPDTVSVTLTITQNPILSLSIENLSYYAEVGGSNPADQTFQISNLGTGFFNYTVSESISWLTVTPSSGGPIPPTATETVTVDINGLTAGTYQGDIIVTAIGAQGSPDTVSVSLTITQDPILSVSPENLTFYAEFGGSNPDEQTFQISNRGGGTFSYTLSESISWLFVTPITGGPVPPTATEPVMVNINGLSVGSYQGDIIVTANGAQGSPDTVSVTLTITQDPILAILPDCIQAYGEVEGNNPDNAYFYVDNVGSGSLNYTISESVSWLSLSVTSGGPVPPLEGIVITFDIAGLQVGDYQGDVIVNAPGALNNPDTLRVYLMIYQVPILSLSTDSLIFNAALGGSNPAEQTFQIDNIGSGFFYYSISESTSWLVVSPMTGGPVPPTANETLSVDITGLSAGSHLGEIIVNATDVQGSPDTVIVHLEITQNPILSVTPDTLVYNAQIAGSLPNDQTIQIANIGTGTFGYIITENVPWLLVSSMSGGPVPPTATDTVSVDTTGLAAGVYEGDIVITATGTHGNPDTVHVIFNIESQSVLLLEREDITFHFTQGGEIPGPETFTIANAGGGVFYFEAVESASWLELSDTLGGPVPPTFEDTVFVADISGLSPGIYEHDIVIYAEGAMHSPENIHVILDITANDVQTMANAKIPTDYVLQPPYPNPFNPTTQITYYLPENSRVTLLIYNILGQRVVTLVDDVQTYGFQKVFWNGKSSSGEDVASGIYFYRIKANDFIDAKKMVLLR